MKFLIVFVALFAVALAAPGSTADADAQIVRQEADVGPESHKTASETTNHIVEESEGQLKDAGSDHEAYVHKGSYSWVDDKTGEKFTVEYIADENGFQPKGAHIPQP